MDVSAFAHKSQVFSEEILRDLFIDIFQNLILIYFRVHLFHLIYFRVKKEAIHTLGIELLK